MLLSLAIRDVVLIDRLDLAFQPGLSVLTGETGAGKSILLDALGLALGQRGDSGLVRSGSAQAVVTAEFDLPLDHPVRSLLNEQGLEIEGSLLLRRILAADGRSRALINDQAASVGLLRQVGALLVEIQGQFDQHGLLDSETHRDVLDAFAESDALRTEVATAHVAWRGAARQRAEAEAAAAKAGAEEAFLRHAHEELDRFRPLPGEAEELAARRTALQHREKLLEGLNAVAGEMTSAEGAVNAAARHLSRLPAAVADQAGGALAALDRAAAELAEAAAELDRLLRDDEAGGDRLEQIEERLFALRQLARKHQVEPDALAALRDRMAADLTRIEEGGAGIERLARAEQAARDRFIAAAKRLGERRAKAAARLDKAVMAEFPPLKLEKARFRSRIEPLPEAGWSDHGIDRVTFEIATNPGATPAPLGKVVSGGELSRIMLALKVVLAASSPVPTLVFDEVDSGIGGAVAAAVGERLARLGSAIQVLCVTHSPQVAARAGHHWQVAKQGTGIVKTTVHPLDDQARREEIARMLSGAVVTDEARRAADMLMASH